MQVLTSSYENNTQLSIFMVYKWNVIFFSIKYISFPKRGSLVFSLADVSLSTLMELWPFVSFPFICEPQLCALPVKPDLASRDYTISFFLLSSARSSLFSQAGLLLHVLDSNHSGILCSSGSKRFLEVVLRVWPGLVGSLNPQKQILDVLY